MSELLPIICYLESDGCYVPVVGNNLDYGQAKTECESNGFQFAEVTNFDEFNDLKAHLGNTG